MSKTAPLDMDALARQYGLSAAMLNSSKELMNLVKQGIREGWQDSSQGMARFQAKLKNTRWWATQPDTLRQYITERYTDPATWKQKWTGGQASVNALAVQVGLGVQINAKGQSSALLQGAIYNSLALGWSDARIKDWLGQRVAVHGGIMGGEAGDAFDKLHSMAYVNGVKLSPAWYQAAARGVVSGRDTLERQEAQIRQWAAAKYSAFADQIKAGQNVMDLASPYIESVSKILETPGVDLFDAHVSKAMMANKGGQSYSIWQFENELRKDPAWKKTQSAQDSAMQTAHQVLQSFGMAF